MKNVFLFIIMFFLFSCSNEKKDKVQRFIDADLTEDYDYFLENLSHEYKEALKLQFDTPNLHIAYDSIVSSRKSYFGKLKEENILFKNHVINHITTSNKNLKIIKYRTHFTDMKNNSELFKEYLILEDYSNNGEKKYTPYIPKSTIGLDSILKEKYSATVLDEITSAIIFKEYTSDDPIFKKTEKRFTEYISYFDSYNMELLKFIYPPLFKSLAATFNQHELSIEQKELIIKYLKQARDTQPFNVKRFLIDGFEKIDCATDIHAYIIDYAIDVNKNTYLPGKTIVIIENDEVYFLEADMEIIKTYFSSLFSDNFISCVENMIKD